MRSKSWEKKGKTNKKGSVVFTCALMNEEDSLERIFTQTDPETWMWREMLCVGETHQWACHVGWMTHPKFGMWTGNFALFQLRNSPEVLFRQYDMIHLMNWTDRQTGTVMGLERSDVGRCAAVNDTLTFLFSAQAASGYMLTLRSNVSLWV